MHRRKKFLVYPPNYKPGDGFVVRHSKLQAWKVAAQMGVGASVDVDTRIHPARRHDWTSSTHTGLWGPLTLKTPNAEITGRTLAQNEAGEAQAMTELKTLNDLGSNAGLDTCPWCGEVIRPDHPTGISDGDRMHISCAAESEDDAMFDRDMRNLTPNA